MLPALDVAGVDVDLAEAVDPPDVQDDRRLPREVHRRESSLERDEQHARPLRCHDADQHAPPGRPEGVAFAVEQGGRIMAVSPDGEVAETPVLDIAERITAGGEQGLLGLALHPDFRTNGRLFVNYTRADDGATVVAEFRVGANGLADPASERQLLVIDQPYPNHNGGMIGFDAEGMLLIGMGDGGAGGDPEDRAQDPTELLGKLLRIDPAGQGVRYATCSLCACEWQVTRNKCVPCRNTCDIAYLSPTGEAATLCPAVEAETCPACHRSLKIASMETDPLVDAFADDLATLALDMQADQAGFHRAGRNLFLFAP